MSKPATTSLPFSTTIAIHLAYGIIRGLYSTLNIKVTGKEHILQQRRSGEGYVLALWHCNVLLTPIIERDSGVMVMVSTSRDGDIISGVVEKLGNQPVRGSSSKGGRRVLGEIITRMREGQSAAITPDGPLGPYMKLKSGVVVMAQRAGVPIIPFHYEPDSSWRLSSWDRQPIPKPFSKLYVRYGAPLRLPADPDDFNASVIRAEQALLANVRACRQWAKHG